MVWHPGCHTPTWGLPVHLPGKGCWEKVVVWGTQGREKSGWRSDATPAVLTEEACPGHLCWQFQQAMRCSAGPP